MEYLQPKPTIVALDTFSTFTETMRVINHLKKGKARIDDIPPEVMKGSGYLLKRRLLHVITQACAEVVPQDLKDAVIVPIYKKNRKIVQTVATAEASPFVLSQAR